MRQANVLTWWTAAAVLLLPAAALAAGGGNTCAFQNRGLVLSFGNLDPSSASDVPNTQVQEAAQDAKKWGDCAPGVSMTLSADDGLHFSGTRRMKRVAPAGPDYIRYTLTALPTGVRGPGNGIYVSFTFAGTVLGMDYADAPAGDYEDTVQVTVTP